MAGTLKKVTGGAPLRIPAADYNAFVEAAKAHINSQSGQDVGGSEVRLRNDLILVKNSSGDSRGQSEILGIDTPIILPIENLNEFQNRLAVVGVVPSAAHAENFVILVEPIPSGRLGLGWISGVCQVKIEVMAEGDTTAGVVIGRTTSLRSGVGSIPIIWKEPGRGIKWGIVKFAVAGGTGSAVEHVVVLEVFDSTENPFELVKVQAVDRNTDTGKIELVGAEFMAQAKPGLQSKDYFPWKWAGPIDQRLTRFLPCYKIRGNWRLGWEPDVIAEVLPPNVRFTDCIPVSRAGGIR